VRFTLFSCANLILGAALLTTATGRSEAQPVPLTRPQLIQCIEAARGQISDFSVSFRFDADTAPANQLHARSHRRVLLKDGRVRVDHEYAQMPEYDGATYIVSSAFDGVRYTHHLGHLRQATRTLQPSTSVETKGAGFFDMMMWNPSASGQGSGYSDQDLLSVLRSARSTLRPSLEDVEGHACIVVDERDESTGEIAFTAWIDVDRGFLPIQQRYLDSSSGRPVMEFFMDAAHQASPLVWVPTEGRKVNHVIPGVPELDRRTVSTLMVDRDAAGNPVLAVNSGIADEEFDVLTTLPPGTRVGDVDTGQRWTVAGKDFERLGESFDTQIANARKSDPDLDRRLSAGFTQVSQVSTERILPSPVALVLAGAGIGAIGYTGLRLCRGRASV
jgi:hypothetical protein